MTQPKLLTWCLLFLLAFSLLAPAPIFAEDGDGDSGDGGDDSGDSDGGDGGDDSGDPDPGDGDDDSGDTDPGPEEPGPGEPGPEGTTCATTPTISSGEWTTVLAGNQQPNAVFSASTLTPTIGEVVTFDASATTDDHGIVSYKWSFGDGTTATGKVVTHTYTSFSATPRIVLLTVMDAGGTDVQERPVLTTQTENCSDGTTTVTSSTAMETQTVPSGSLSDTATASLTMQLVCSTTTSVSTDAWATTEGNQTPIAAFTVSTSTPILNEEVTFDASLSTDDHGIALYQWDLGDGTTATGKIVAHAYTSFSTSPLTVTLAITDTGGVDTQKRTVTTTKTTTCNDGSVSVLPSTATETRVVPSPVRSGLKEKNILMQNTPPGFTALPEVVIQEDSGLNEDVLDLPAYAVDAETPPSGLTFALLSQSNPSIVSCSLDSQNLLDCEAVPYKWGSSELLIEVSDGELTGFGLVQVIVDPFEHGDNDEKALNSRITIRGVTLSQESVCAGDSLQLSAHISGKKIGSPQAIVSLPGMGIQEGFDQLKEMQIDLPAHAAPGDYLIQVLVRNDKTQDQWSRTFTVRDCRPSPEGSLPANIPLAEEPPQAGWGLGILVGFTYLAILLVIVLIIRNLVKDRQRRSRYIYGVDYHKL